MPILKTKWRYVLNLKVDFSLNRTTTIPRLLEQEATCVGEAVIVGVICGGSGLETNSRGETRSTSGILSVKREFAEHETRCKKGLDFPVFGAAVPSGSIDLQLRPDVLLNVILENLIGGEGTTDRCGVACGERTTNGHHSIEFAEAFATGDGGSDGGVGRSVFITSGRDGCGNVGAEEVVAVLLISGENAEFARE